MSEFIQHLLNGLSTGSIYALIALGYTMVFGVLKLINFAHGDLVMIGAFVAFYAARWRGTDTNGPLPTGSWGFAGVVFIVSMAACAALGFVIERFAYRPLRKQPRITALITAIAIS